MILIVGLGNPGKEYKNTRHNVGFGVIDKIFNIHYSTPIQYPSFQLNKPLQSEIAHIEIEKESVLLAKPQTFMNNSGLAVKKMVTSYQLQVTRDVIVVHDDITLDLGQIKISKGAGAGNHNGVQSVIDQLKTKDFIRVRCGIGRGDGILKDVVLSRFKPDEKEIVEAMIKTATDACFMMVKEGLEKAINTFNKK
jgi:PTH1 family peptidyl-tRNA hydrolase